MVNALPFPDGAAGPDRPRRRATRLGLAGAALLALAGCADLPGASLFAPPRQVRGHVVDQADLAQITVGVSSRNDVQALLGSPSATGTFDDNDWYYISGVTRLRPGRTFGLEDQQVVQIRFDGRGTVREIRRLGEEDGREIRVVERITPSPGNERTLLQQLFGNIGRVGPGLGAQQSTGPGSPSPSGR